MEISQKKGQNSPELFYDSADRKPAILDEIIELFRYRYLLRLLIAQSLSSRYKRSVLGLLWTFLNPLLSMIVLSIVFANLFQTTLTNYPVFILSGIIFWTFFSQSTSMAINSTVWGSSLLKRVYLPRSIFPATAIGHGLTNMLLSFIPLVGVMVIMHHHFSRALLFLPIAMLLAATFSLGISLLVSTLAVYFTDVADMYQVLLSAWFYLTAVVFPISILPPSVIAFTQLNPAYNLLVLFRDPIYLGTIPAPGNILAGIVSALVSLLLGWWVFTRKSHEFAYRI
jgi:ABC-type polysaccharide/polyol phosphate export permease